jgi:hypothetical protein
MELCILRMHRITTLKACFLVFAGWDRYILTEDEVLENFLEHVIRKYIPRIFYKYKIIYVGGGSNTVALMDRNASHNFLSSKENVIAILDGDQRGEKYAQRDSGIDFLPWESVEKKLFADYNESETLTRVPDYRNGGIDNPNGKICTQRS